MLHPIVRSTGVDGWVGLRVGPDLLEYIKISFSYQECNQEPSAAQPLAESSQRLTFTMPAPAQTEVGSGSRFRSVRRFSNTHAMYLARLLKGLM